MPRPRRNCLEEATYHVFSRCINRRNMMQNDYYKDIMLCIIENTMAKYSFDLVFYQIMDNHIHLVIKTRKGEATISRIMQYLKARFAENYNRKNSRTGPFWNERFRDVIVELQDNPVLYLLWLLWYLAYNAVRAAKVNDPRNYRYGCIRHYLQNEYTDKLQITPHRFFLNLGGGFMDRVREFLALEDIYRKKLWMGF